MTRNLLAGAVVILGVATTATPTFAQSSEIQKCADASEQAQKLRDDQKLMSAREQLMICVRDACPAIIRKDCTEWLASLEGDLPSIVLQARDRSGADRSAVKVSLDGRPLVETLDGKAIPVDPGRHTFRFEAQGEEPLEQEVVVSVGEKNRPVTIVFASGADAAPGDAPPAGGVTTPASRSFVLPIVLGAVGAVALGSWGFFGLTGKSDFDALENGCGRTRTCSQSDVDAVHTKFLIADVSLAVGVVSLGVGTFFLVRELSKGDGGPRALGAPRTAARPPSGLPRFDVRPLAGGGSMAGLSGTF